jgi:hypothetical protein
MYYVNGDAPADPVIAGDPPLLVERGHPGWNWVDCQLMLTNDQPVHWSALTGLPGGCQPFTVLDSGDPPGRPDPDDAAGTRVLRGFVYAWAVNELGEEICWNHLKGDAVIVNYANTTAWEYNAYAAPTNCCIPGEKPGDPEQPCDHRYCEEIGKGCEKTEPVPGEICLNGCDYGWAFQSLLLDFYASGSQALSQFGGLIVASVDTDLTLFPVDADLRQDTCGPVSTKAQFDIWNMNEIRFSGTTRCITCWDQTLLGNYAAPNHFMIGNLHTDKGKARIHGVASSVCDPYGCRDWCDKDNPGPVYPNCSVDTPLLGVAKKEIAFSGLMGGRAEAGMTLVGMGEMCTCIKWDIIKPPDGLINQFYGEGIVPNEGASRAQTRIEKK